jgi:hypothetical protein
MLHGKTREQRQVLFINRAEVGKQLQRFRGYHKTGFLS